jgi:hypothetical protein
MQLGAGWGLITCLFTLGGGKEVAKLWKMIPLPSCQNNSEKAPKCSNTVRVHNLAICRISILIGWTVKLDVSNSPMT